MVCIVACMVVASFATAFAGKDSYASEKSEVLIKECNDAINIRHYDIVEAKGRELARLGRAEDSMVDEVVGESFVLRAQVCRRDTADMSAQVVRLESGLPVLVKQEDYKDAAYVAKAISIYYHFILSDYSQASSYAFKTLEYARKASDLDSEIDALSGLASIYFAKNDTSGFSYALDCYNKAKKEPGQGGLYVAASNMANYLFNDGKYDEAMRYLKEAQQLAVDRNMDMEQSYIDSFFGDIYSAMGQKGKAEEYYRKSFDFKPSTNSYDRIYAHVCYAIFLMNIDRLDQAVAELQEAERMSMQYKVNTFRIQIYSYLARIYEAKNDYRAALAFQKRATELRDTIYSKEKEREFALLDLRYRVSEEKLKNAEQSMELMRRGRTLIAVVSAAVLLLLVVVALFLYHRRTMRSYRDVVGRHLETAATERRLRQQLEAALADRVEAASHKSSAITGDRRREMFDRLEKMMKEEKVYRQSDLSLEKLAGMLETNRTYLSQLVNEETGTSFTTYVNSYRLQEAIELLSDPANDEPLKNIGLTVGFSSPSNFYSLFRQKVGVSPSIFRTNVRNIINDRNTKDAEKESLKNQFDNQDLQFTN